MLTQVKSNLQDTLDTDSPFAKKWLQIQKKQKRNASTKKKIDDLYQVFQNEILPEEQKIVALIAQETLHLITFLPRKSFTQWQREELQTWIEGNLETLNEHPFGNAELFKDVSTAYRDALVQEAQKIDEDHEFLPEEIDYMRSMADQMFQGKKEFTNEELQAFMRDPTVFQETLQNFLSEQAQKQESNFTDDEQDEGEFSQEESEYHGKNTEDPHVKSQLNKQSKLKSLFNAGNLNKLYKLLANRLHPDKETNEHLKAEKTELMSQLVTAKKNKDAFTIISMFHQFMPDSENTFFDGDDTELGQALITLLNEKSHELDKENSDEKYSNGLKSMVWNKLNGRSKKVTQENINSHLADLEDDHTRLNYYIHEVKTVVLLKEILTERYEQRNTSPFGDAGFSLDMLDEFFR